MKKLFSLLLCAALMMIMMPGCGRQEEEKIDETQAPTQGVEQVELELPVDERPYVGVQLRFLALLEETDPRADVVKQAVEVFERRTGAAMEVCWISGGEDLLALNLENGIQTDIFAASLDGLGNRFGAYALDLTELAAQAQYEQHSYPVLREQVVERCGCLAGIPQEPLVYGVYYNAEVFAEAGLTELPGTWEEFLSFSQSLVQAGFMPLAMDIENTQVVLELHLERHLGAERFEHLMRDGGWLQQRADIELFRLAIQYAEAGYLAKGDPVAYPGGQDKLALSNVAMVVGSSALCAQVERSTMMNVSWGVFPYPGDGAGKGFAVESQVLAVHKDSANAQAAFDFIMLLTTGEFDQLYASVSEGIPADPANTSAIAGARELLAQADTRGIGLLSDANTELFSRLWNGWYKTPDYFASAMNRLQVEYIPKETQGVG